MAAYASLLYIWKLPAREVRCNKGCGKKIRLVIDNRGKHLPFEANATPLREHKTDRGTFEIYEPSAFHKCAGKRVPAKKAAPQRELFAGGPR